MGKASGVGGGRADCDAAALVATRRLNGTPNVRKEHKAMIKVVRLSHAELATRDPTRLAEFYTSIFGLAEMGKDKDRVFLGTSTGQLALVLRHSSNTGCSKATFQVAPQIELSEVTRSLRAKGIAAKAQSDPAPGPPSTLSNLWGPPPPASIREG
jgi:hypothetical protein